MMRTPSQKSAVWSGAIACLDQERTWHAAALFYLSTGPCQGFSSRKRVVFPNLRLLEQHLENAMSMRNNHSQAHCTSGEIYNAFQVYVWNRLHRHQAPGSSVRLEMTYR